MSSNVRILLVDDDQDSNFLFIEALTDVIPDVDYACALNAEEALRILHEPTIPLPHFIFLDLNMPRMNGKECLKEIKKIDRASNIPVIIYTTYRREDDVKETKELGAAYFLVKPEVYTDLKKEISDIVYQGRQQEA